MTPSEWLLDETRKWVQNAQHDLRAAELCANEVPSEALFHCQQAAEKYLKAYLTWNQAAFRKTHDLEELVAACSGLILHCNPLLTRLRRYRSTRGSFAIRAPLTSLTRRKRRLAALWPNKCARKSQAGYRRPPQVEPNQVMAITNDERAGAGCLEGGLRPLPPNVS